MLELFGELPQTFAHPRVLSKLKRLEVLKGSLSMKVFR